MFREKLASRVGERLSLTALVDREAKRISDDGINFNQWCILFKDIKDQKGNVLTDHAWVSEIDFANNVGFDNLVTGDIISFRAKVRKYKNKRNERNFGLTDILNINKVYQLATFKFDCGDKIYA